MNNYLTNNRKRIEKAMANGKEFFYVGHYIAKNGAYVLKVGTTDNPIRRRYEHNQKYRKTPNYPMNESETFEYDWMLPLSKYTTLRVEDNTKKYYQEIGLGKYLNNDRFIFSEKPTKIEVKVRKIYTITL